MGATFARVKTWNSLENLTNEDLNAEIQNILDNLTPSGVDDYSATTNQMRIQTSPGAQGSESAPTSLAGELERIRFVINRIIGQTYWYDTPVLNLGEVNTLISLANSIPSNRIVSGRIRGSGSNQPIFLVPNGSTNSVSLQGASTNLVVSINSTQYTISSNVSATGLSLAPSSNNTCLVNDSAMADAVWTKTQGEYGTVITVDAMGSEISSRVGTYQAFKIVTNAGTEYFTAYVASSTELRYAQRGYFFNSADSPLVRYPIGDNDVITLMKLTWVFLKTDSTLEATYNRPVYGGTQPTSGSTGDYWYDTVNTTWKRYDGASWASAGAILIGTCIQDTANCVAARSADFYKPYEATNTIFPERTSNTEAKSLGLGAKISVAGQLHYYEHDFVKWDITLHLDSGITEGSSTAYYLYITDTGKSVISDIVPYDRRHDLRGYYHPHNPWRYVGAIYNDGSSNVTLCVSEAGEGLAAIASPGEYVDSGKATANHGSIIADGTAYSRAFLFRLWGATGSTHGYGDNSTTFNICDSRGRFRRNWAGTGSSNDPDRASRTAMNTGGNSGDAVGAIQSYQHQAHTHTYLTYNVVQVASGAGSFVSGQTPPTDNTGSTGGNETRPLNYNAGCFVRV